MAACRIVAVAVDGSLHSDNALNCEFYLTSYTHHDLYTLKFKFLLIDVAHFTCMSDRKRL